MLNHVRESTTPESGIRLPETRSQSLHTQSTYLLDLYSARGGRLRLLAAPSPREPPAGAWVQQTSSAAVGIPHVGRRYTCSSSLRVYFQLIRISNALISRIIVRFDV